MEAADQLSVVGDKIQDIGDKAVSAYAETENAVTKVNAYFGETGAAAEASAEIVKDVYGAGVGDSMESVADAVIMVKKNLGEYSGKFAQAGYSASEYFQLLQNGLQGGAYNLDKVIDSIVADIANRKLRKARIYPWPYVWRPWYLGRKHP